MYKNLFKIFPYLILQLILIELVNIDLYSSDIRYSLVRVDFKGGIEELSKTIGFEIDEENVLDIDNEYFYVVLNHFEVEILRNKGLKFDYTIPNFEEYIANNLLNAKSKETILEDSEGFKLGSMSGYFKLNEIYDFFDNLSLKYPEQLSEKYEIGRSIENRPIYFYKLGNLEDDNIPKVLITALHHSREPLCLMTLAYFLNDLLKKYQENDELAKSILDNSQIYLVPVVNPDGYIFNQIRYPKGGGLWRKNRRQHNDSTFGVDINRNYGPYEYWNAQNFGSSTDSTIETYRGKSPFSEPETQAIKHLCEQNEFKLALNLHSFGNLLLYPNSALSKETKDSMLFRGIARHISSKNLYSFGRDLQTVGYTSRGTSDDWMYLETAEKGKIFAITAEIGTPADFFWPEASKIIPYCKKALSLYYDFLTLNYSNIIPVDYYGYFNQEQNEFRLSLKLQNIGVKESGQYIRISFETLNDNIIVENPQRTIGSLKPSEHLVEHFRIRRRTAAKVEKEKFIIIVNNEKYIYRDTIELYIDKYDSLNLYENGKLDGSWMMGEWGLEYLDELKTFVLSDSPKGFYKDNTDNLLIRTTPLSINSKDAVLEFTTKWSTEANKDACTVQISTDDGKSWQFLRTERMIEGDGADRSRFKKGLFGLNGTFHEWNTQSVTLSEFNGEDILLSFGLLSDMTKNFDGWYIKNIKLKFYQSPNSAQEKSDMEMIKVFPNPVTEDNQNLIINSQKINDFNFTIIDCLGRNHNIFIISKTESSIIINTNDLQSGSYFLRIQDKNGVISRKFFVIK